MTAFLTSDVIYSQRVVPYIKKALDDNDIAGQTIASSRFLPSIDWLDESEVASRLGATAPASSRRRGPPAPGTHGHGLTSVSVGGTELTTDSANRIQASPNLTFTVNFENQAENDEQGVVVRVEITGAGLTDSRPGHGPADHRGQRGHGGGPAAPHPARRQAGGDQGHGRARPRRGRLEQQHRRRTRRSSRAGSPVRLSPCGGVDDLTTTQGIVALAACGVALVALVLAIVVAVRLRRLRRAQAAVLGEGGAQDLVAHAASLQDDFRALRD